MRTLRPLRFLASMPLRARTTKKKATFPAAHPKTAAPATSLVTAFRLRFGEVDKLKASFPAIATDGSHHLLARKLCRDFVDGKLVYLNSEDRLKSRETG